MTTRPKIIERGGMHAVTVCEEPAGGHPTAEAMKQASGTIEMATGRTRRHEPAMTRIRNLLVRAGYDCFTDTFHQCMYDVVRERLNELGGVVHVDDVPRLVKAAKKLYRQRFTAITNPTGDPS